MRPPVGTYIPEHITEIDVNAILSTRKETLTTAPPITTETDTGEECSMAGLTPTATTAIYDAGAGPSNTNHCVLFDEEMVSTRLFADGIPRSSIIAPRIPRVSLEGVNEEVSDLAANADDTLFDAVAELGIPLDCHGVSWRKDDAAVLMSCNSTPPFRMFRARNAMGNEYTSNSCSYDSPIDYFRMMMPNKAITHILGLTQENLRKCGEPSIDHSELMCFFGVLILGTRFEWTNRRSLWSLDTPSRFIPAPNFAKTGMSRNCFDVIWQCIRFSEQPTNIPDGMTAEDHRWMLCDDFVSFINEHRKQFMTPGQDLCVDESIVRWYGLGGDWINCGLPMYIAMDRKPENGCEIQNVCDGQTGIMLRLLLVKLTKSANRDLPAKGDATNHGTKVIQWLCSPWAKTNRIVYADSYFASVQTARELYKMGLRFTGVVKTSSRGFPLQHLLEIQFGGHGEWSGLYHRGDSSINDPDMLGFVWVDKDRRNFISTVSSLSPAAPIERKRMRQVVNDITSPPEKVLLTIKQPQCSKRYYDNCGRIDQHNRVRQDDLRIKRKYATHDWSKRVNFALLGMCITDAYYLKQFCDEEKETPHQFFSLLAEELIDYGRASRQRIIALKEADKKIAATRAERRTEGTGRVNMGCGVKGPHLTPNKKCRVSAGSDSFSSDNSGSSFTAQMRCNECQKGKTTWLCSECLATSGEKVPLCHTKYRSQCWETHIEAKHVHFAPISQLDN